MLEENGLLDTLYFLPLQTTSESVFNRIDKILICDNRIYIRDFNDQFLIFDINGKFIKKLKTGQGPGEIFKLRDFTYDKKSKQLLVCYSDFISFYNADGNYINTIHIPFMFFDLCATEWGYFSYYPSYINYHLGYGSKFAAYIANKDFKIIGKGINVIPDSYISKFPTSRPHVQNNYSEVILAPTMNDTIFTITQSGIKARYILDYSKYKADCTNEEKLAVSDKYYHCSGFVENSRTQLFRFHSPKKGSYHVLLNKKTGAVKGCSMSTISKDEAPLCCFSMLTTYKDFFVNYVEPYKGMHYSSPAISAVENQKVSTLNDQDNPVLIFYKIKNF